jgi:hypothetical protein
MRSAPMVKLSPSVGEAISGWTIEVSPWFWRDVDILTGSGACGEFIAIQQ